MARTRAVFGTSGLALAGALLGFAGEAGAVEHEVYALVGGGYFGGTSRVLVGLGPGVGYRLHITGGFAVHADQRWLLYGGNAFTTSVGATYEFLRGSWAPALGLQFTAHYGDQIQVIDGGSPDVPGTFNVGLQLHVAPLRFRRGSFTASALVVDYGYALERGAPALAVSFSFVEIGVRF